MIDHVTALAHQDHAEEILEMQTTDAAAAVAVIVAIMKDLFHLLDLHSVDQDLNLVMQMIMAAVVKKKDMKTVDVNVNVKDLLQNHVKMKVVDVKDLFLHLDLHSVDHFLNLAMQKAANSKDLFLHLDLQLDIQTMKVVDVAAVVDAVVDVDADVDVVLKKKKSIIIINHAINITAHANAILGDAILALGTKKDILEDVQDNVYY